MAKAPADGYTFFIHHNGMATSTALYRKLSYDATKDFEYVAQAVEVPMTMLARKDFPANNLQEMITYIKANKEKINLATAGLGAVSQLCGMMFQRAMGVLTEVPFQGTAPAMNALLGGQVDVMCDQTTQTVPQIKAGTVKLYGVTPRPRQGAAQCADAERAGPGLRGGVARHLCAQGHAQADRGPHERRGARRAEGPRRDPRMDDLGGEIVPDATNTPDARRPG